MFAIIINLNFLFTAEKVKIIFDSRSLNTVKELTFHRYHFKDLICRLVYLIHQPADLSHNTINLKVPSTTKSPMLWLIITKCYGQKIIKTYSNQDTEIIDSAGQYYADHKMDEMGVIYSWHSKFLEL
jgi:hypothetical protein